MNENPRPLDYYFMNNMIFSFLVGDLVTANKMSSEMCPEKREGTIVWVAPRFFYQGLIAYALGQTRKGLAFQRKVESFVDAKNRKC